MPDIGSGIAQHAAPLVREHGAAVDAVDASPGQYRRACERYGELSGLRLPPARDTPVSYRLFHVRRRAPSDPADHDAAPTTGPRCHLGTP
ncbi:hypothetical protein [Streptomyces sp. NPDC048669]|uniref:hypothetical protein n=1 Tax=Streptomyces sp. NPDC048669 TaxID=3155267 RepID=UPI003438A5EE